jgi:hypothetical protein
VSSSLIRRWNILLWGFTPHLRLPRTSNIPYRSLSHSKYVNRTKIMGQTMRQLWQSAPMKNVLEVGQNPNK